MIDKSKIKNYCDRIIEFSLYGLILFIPFSKAMLEICATLAITAWIVKKIVGARILFPSTYLNLPLLVFILTVLASMVTSTHFALSMRAFLRKTLEYLFLYFIVVEFFYEQHFRNNSKKVVKNILMIMLISASVLAFDATVQHFTGKDLIRRYEQQAWRISGSFQMPTDFAAYLIFIIPVSIALFFFELKNKKIKLWTGIITALLVIFLFMSRSEGAWIAFALALVFMSVVRSKKILILSLVIGIILTSFVLIFIKTPLKSLLTLFDTKMVDRKEIWQAALMMVRDNPLFGQGLNTFMPNFTKYAPNYTNLASHIIPYAHNAYLQMAAEIGILGLTAFLWVIITPFVKSLRLLRRIGNKFYGNLLLGLLGGMFAFLAYSAVDTSLQSLQLSILFWIMLGFIVSIGKISEFETV